MEYRTKKYLHTLRQGGMLGMELKSPEWKARDCMRKTYTNLKKKNSKLRRNCRICSHQTKLLMIMAKNFQATALIAIP